jgi:hypothetical protein
MTKILTPLLLVLSLFLPGCVSTEVFDIERHPDFRETRYRKVIVHCSADDATRRAIIETEVSDRLRAAGYEAEASYRVVADPKKPFRLPNHPDYDALVWVGFGAYENEVIEYPGQVQTVVGGGFGWNRWGGWGGGWGWADPFWGPQVGVVYTPPQVISRWWLRTRIELIDGESERKVFSARAASRARNPDSLEDLARDLGGEIARLMSDYRER